MSKVSGPFRVVLSQAVGRRGMDALLHSGTYFTLSINDAIATWAPAFENNTASYQQFLTNALGVSGSTPLSSLSPSQFQTLENAISRQEGLYSRDNYSVTATSVITPP